MKLKPECVEFNHTDVKKAIVFYLEHKLAKTGFSIKFEFDKIEFDFRESGKVKLKINY